MPIYEYRCDNGHSFDVMQRMSDDPITACEVCGAPVQKVLHAPAVHFKGSGFYTTDYGKKKTAGSSGGDSKKSESNGSADSGSSGSGSSDSGSSSSDGSSKSGSSDSKPSKTASKPSD
jgi:putative FmdB family regulatory protein